jgi:hypothetical protein
VFTLILFFLEDYEKGQEAHFFFVSPSSTGPPCPQRTNFNLKIALFTLDDIYYLYTNIAQCVLY